MNFSEHALKTRSEKVTLAILEAVQEVKLFTLSTGAVYYRDVDHFASGVSANGTALTAASNSTLSASQFYFDATAKRIYVRMSDGSNPKTKQVAITFKFFFSNAPVILPHDLSNGDLVEFEGRISSIGAIGQKLDDQNTGIVLESNSSLSLENTDGFFDDIFDRFIWEYRPIRFYSWSPTLPISEAQKIFDGLIESKDFSSSSVSFKVKDFVFKLKNKVNLPLYSSDDGKPSPSTIGTPKRRIYGQVKQLQCVGVAKTLGGFNLTGAISGTLETASISGTGTSFLSELSPGDELFVSLDNETIKIGVESVESDTAFTATDELDVSIVGKSATVKPVRPYRAQNRRWSIAGHKLRAPSATITSVDTFNRVTANNVTDFSDNDSVKVNDEYVFIRRISGNQFVFNTALNPVPEVSDTITKNPVSRAYFGSKEMFIDRDWLLTNTTEAILEIDPLAEFYIAIQRSIGVSLTFTNSSRVVTTAAAVDLRTILQTRDWIRKNSVTETTWHEILEVEEQAITLRVAFAGTTQTTTGLRKNVDLLDDDSLVTVDCIGMEHEGAWIKTPSDAVKHLIEYDAEFASVNEASFTKARGECGYILSLPIPLSVGDKSPEIKSVITLINESVFGSLYGDSSWDISYSIMNSRKPEGIEIMKDDDIISFEVTSEQKIINSIKVNYRPFTDIYTGSDAFEAHEHDNQFVDRLIGIKNSEEVTLYLFEEDKAKIIAQRIAFFRSLSTCKVMIKAKLNLALKSVNDKVFLQLDRLYKRYGGADRRKVGNITSIKKNGFEVDVEMIDLGNIYNRVPAIAPNTANAYASASGDEKALWGYVLDNDTLTPDVSSELELGNNLIG